MLNSPLIKKIINLAIEEDLSMGDITSQLTIQPTQISSANIISREKVLTCGLPLVEKICAVIDKKIDVNYLLPDGQLVEESEILAKLTGPTISLLMAERTLLNFLQRTCGVATHTQSIVRKFENIIILDTRKTIPGWRILDKYATFIGGAKNHRANLGDMILIKNNHIDANSGDIQKVLASVFAKKPEYMQVEIEVRNIAELRLVLQYYNSFPVNIIMLDNMSNSDIESAIQIINKQSSVIKVEISGGIKEERVSSLKDLGVKYLSMGKLTNQARNVDISMRII